MADLSDYEKLIAYERMQAEGFTEAQALRVLVLRRRYELGQLHEETWESQHLRFLRWLVERNGTDG